MKPPQIVVLVIVAERQALAVAAVRGCRAVRQEGLHTLKLIAAAPNRPKWFALTCGLQPCSLTAGKFTGDDRVSTVPVGNF